jgi:hypothetical protein
MLSYNYVLLAGDVHAILFFSAYGGFGVRPAVIRPE